MVVTDLGELIMDLPATRKGLENGEISASLNGLWIIQEGEKRVAADVLFAENETLCLLSAFEVFTASFNHCFFDNQGFICQVEAIFHFVLRVLRCEL
jgi:hypothetical protein